MVHPIKQSDTKIQTGITDLICRHGMDVIFVIKQKTLKVRKLSGFVRHALFILFFYQPFGLSSAINSGFNNVHTFG